MSEKKAEVRVVELEPAVRYRSLTQQGSVLRHVAGAPQTHLKVDVGKVRDTALPSKSDDQDNACDKQGNLGEHRQWETLGRCVERLTPTQSRTLPQQ